MAALANALDALAAQTGMADVSTTSVSNVAGYVALETAGAAADDPPFLSLKFVCLALASYLVGIRLLDVLCGALGTTGESRSFRAFAMIHNLLLGLYSAWSFVAMARILVVSTSFRGGWATYCDDGAESWSVGPAAFVANVSGSTVRPSSGGGGSLWEAADVLTAIPLRTIAWLFYLSKFWEFVDTAILIVKRKPVSFLQSYHHFGAVLTVWVFVVTRCSYIQVFIVMNTFVHAVMYTYFGLSLTRFNWVMAWAKRYITRMQIFQFFLGLFLAALVQIPFLAAKVRGEVGPGGPEGRILLGGPRVRDCQSAREAPLWGLLFGMTYTTILVFLFANFYQRTYSNASGARGAARKKNE
jgi:GNS1/SUR4 family